METTSAKPPGFEEERGAIAAISPGDFFPSHFLHANRSGARLVAVPRRGDALSRTLTSIRRGLEVLWQVVKARICRAPKALVVSATAALGDRRMVSVVQFERQRFLIGCGHSSVTLLARLPDAESVTTAEQRESLLPTGGGGQ